MDALEKGMILEWRVKFFLEMKGLSKDQLLADIDSEYKFLLEDVLHRTSPPRECNFDFLEAIANAIRLQYDADLGISDLVGFKKAIPPKYDEEGRASAAWKRGN